MKRRIKRVISFFLYITGMTPLFLKSQLLRKKTFIVLLYHKVRRPEDLFEAAISPENFENQMRFLSEKFHVVSIKEVLEAKERRQIPKKPLAAITFDDGYRDNLQVAYPILKRYALPATFFLATGSIGNKEPMWTSRVEAMFKDAPNSKLILQTLSPPRDFELAGDHERLKACYEIKNEMKRVPESQRLLILEELERKTSFASSNYRETESEMLSWEEVRQLAQDPLVEIGSHSVSHRMFANLSLEELRSELAESKKKIEAEIEREVHFLSYPGNSYNRDVERCAKEAGYKAAFVVNQSFSSFDEDPFSLKRVHVEDGPLYVFQAEISLLLQFIRSWLDKFFSKKKFPR